MNQAQLELAVPDNLGAARRRQLKEKLIAWAVTGIGLTGILAMVLIVVFIAKEALPLLWDPHARAEASWSKLFLPQTLRATKPPGYMWQPVSGIPKLSMIPLFLGTLKVTVVSMVLAVPLGVGSALFASEFAPRRLREILKPVIELLAGIPSVVLGFFALMVLATHFQDTFGFTYRLNGIVAGVGLALAIVPIIFTVSEDALRAVPQSYREASLALGATRWETAWRIILPAAAPGVLAACVLGLGRAIGETMIVLMASGNAAVVSPRLSDSVRTLSATIAAEMGEVVVGSPHYSVLFFIGVELFVVTFLLNFFAGLWVSRFVRRQAGAR
jgi:phosphate transport system permease protein